MSARDCELIAGATKTLRRRIFAKIVKPAGGRRAQRRGCWTWTGGFARKRGSRRPKIQVGGDGTRTVTVARLLLVLLDRVPLSKRDDAKLEAAHRCGNAECVNWHHLQWKTRTENEADKYFDNGFDEFASAVDELAAEERDGAAA